MYFDEDLLLDLRLNILNDHVKKFVITESTYLHSGKEKKLKFDYKNFKKFRNKIIYKVIDTPPPGIKNINKNDDLLIKNKKTLDNSVLRENYQRNKLQEGLNEANENDIILLSDLDEIPNLTNFKFKNKITLFEQKVFYYKFNLLQPNFIWNGTRACLKKQLKGLQWLRNIKSKSYSPWRVDAFFSNTKYMNIDFVKNGGWHFTFIKKPEDIFFKLSNFLHHLEFEYSGLSLEDTKKMIAQKKIIYDHSAKQEDLKYTGRQVLVKAPAGELPNYLNENLNKYSEWID